MQENLLITPPTGKVYSTKMIVIGSFFGGVLAGSYMMYRNFKTLGEERKANLTVVFTLISLVFIGLSVFIPALDKAPTFFYSLLFTLITAFITQKYLTKPLNEFMEGGGGKYSRGKVFLICIIATAVIVSIMIGAFLMQDVLVS